MTKLLLITSTIAICLLLFASCKTTKYMPADFPDEQITFGSGGGISGLVNDYTLLQNGQLFKRSSADNVFVELKSVKKDAVNQVMKNYTFLGINEMTIDQPGNLYYFIEHKDKTGKTHRLTWGNGEAAEEENLKLYYAQLSSLLPKK